jgi:hypothetical protein
VDAFAAAIEASPFATALRLSRWTYPLVNAGHVLGVALLVGAVVPMDLRLIGLWRRGIALPLVLRLLRPVAACGAVLAIVTGLCLFSVQASDYAAMPLFWLPRALVGLGLGHALAQRGLAAAPPSRQRRAGALSLVLWPSVLLCGRLLGYV